MSILSFGTLILPILLFSNQKHGNANVDVTIATILQSSLVLSHKSVTASKSNYSIYFIYRHTLESWKSTLNYRFNQD